LLILLLTFYQAISQPEIQQDPYLKFDHLTKKEGLSNNYVLDIYQDKLGFIWIGTIDGLNRYNGYEFEIFHNDQNDSSTISGNFITSIVEDVNGNLWFGTKTGLNKYNYKSHTFKRYYHDINDENTLSDNFIRALYADKHGLLWIETSDGTLHKYNLATDSIIRYKHRAPYMINTYFYHKIFEDNHGNIWLGGRNMGIFKFNPKVGVFHEIWPDLKDSTKKRDRDVANYFIDSSGIFWISGIDGLYTFNDDEEIFKKILPVSTFSVQEDNNGKLWFGTGGGVYVYETNKNHFTKYSHDENNPNSLIANRVNKVMIDYSGNIWVGTNEGISIHSPSKNKFKLIYHIPVNENTPVSNNITTILQDANNNIWLGTAYNGIDCFDENLNKIDHYGNKESTGHQTISNRISTLMEDKDGDIWVGQWSGRGFNIIDPKTNKIDSFSKVVNSLKVDWYSDMIQDSDGNYWIGIWGGVGFQQFDKEGGVFNDRTFTLLNVTVNSPVTDMIIDNELIWVPNSHRCFPAFNINNRKYNMYFPENSMWLLNLKINQIYLDNEKKLWLATNKGLYLKVQNLNIYFKPYLTDNILFVANSNNNNLLWTATSKGIKLFNKKTRSYEKTGEINLIDNKISFMFEDADNCLWIGTKSGLYTKQHDNKNLEKTSSYPFNNINLSANCNLQKSNGDFLIGTSSGLYYYNKTKNIFTKKDILSNHQIYSMALANSGNTWIGTDNGLYEIKQNKIIASFVVSDSSNNSLTGNSVFSIGFDKNDRLWLGTDKGLGQLDKTTGNITMYNKKKNNYLSSHLVNVLHEDKQGNLWVGTTDEGLNKIEVKTGKIITFQNNKEDSISFWGRKVSSILQDRKGTIWVGGFGLNKYIPADETFVHYTKADGLADNEVMGILEDKSGKLWISTKNGLSRFDPQTQCFQNFFLKDGLPDDEFTRACSNFKKDYLLFGCKKGLVVANPEKISVNHTVPKVTISRFLIFDKKTDYQFPPTKSIEIAYNQNYFSFEFAALDFSSPKENKYAYKLENFDEHWVTTSANDRKARYTNVPPGEYVFKVKASNNDGYWNEAEASVLLNIKPPYWRTLWFYLLEVLLFVLAIVAYIKYREKNILEKNKLLLLEQKLLRSQMNPHFIFNTLTSIQSFIFEKNPLEAGSYLSKFSDLVRSILYNSREEFISLEKEISMLNNYLEIQQLRYNDEFDYKIDTDPGIDTEALAIPPMLAQPVIENSVKHGIRQLDKRGFISIKLSLLENSISLIVEDNGIGIAASNKMKNKNTKEHKSLALNITKERISILNNKAKKKLYSMKITDIIGDEQRVIGTKVEFIIPIIEI